MGLQKGNKDGSHHDWRNVLTGHVWDQCTCSAGPGAGAAGFVAQMGATDVMRCGKLQGKLFRKPHEKQQEKLQEKPHG